MTVEALADVVAPRLFLDLVGAAHLPPGFVDDLGRFQLDHGTVKVDCALSGPIPWSAEGRSGRRTVHLADSMDHLTMYAAELSAGQVPWDPFLVIGQMTTTDPSARRREDGDRLGLPQHARGDAGGDGLKGTWDDDETERSADRMQARVERYARVSAT